MAQHQNPPAETKRFKPFSGGKAEDFNDPYVIVKEKRKDVSNFQKTFCQNYVKRFNNENQLMRHPNMVKKVLFTEVNCSTMVNYKWSSHTARRRLLNQSNIHPEIDLYPFNKEDLTHTCEHLKNRKLKKSLEGRKKEVNKSFENEENALISQRDDLILDTEKPYEEYMSGLERFFRGNRQIFSMRLKEYKDVVSLSKNLDDNAQPDITSAFQVQDYVMDLIQKLKKSKRNRHSDSVSSFDSYHNKSRGHRRRSEVSLPPKPVFNDDYVTNHMDILPSGLLMHQRGPSAGAKPANKASPGRSQRLTMIPASPKRSFIVVQQRKLTAI